MQGAALFERSGFNNAQPESGPCFLRVKADAVIGEAYQ